jgi:hypothetical protein
MFIVGSVVEEQTGLKMRLPLKYDRKLSGVIAKYQYSILFYMLL